MGEQVSVGITPENGERALPQVGEHIMANIILIWGRNTFTGEDEIQNAFVTGFNFALGAYKSIIERPDGVYILPGNDISIPVNDTTRQIAQERYDLPYPYSYLDLIAYAVKAKYLVRDPLNPSGLMLDPAALSAGRPAVREKLRDFLPERSDNV